ncbi:sialin [Drosophila obscura]|uniref:sialin n=1 Tax=Drosophila obscura TaxID=7282 RepID=UPI001BB260B6|nr:sialin [Drosophila obscura]
MTEEVPARGSILGKLVPARYVLALLGSIGMAIVYGLKVNLSVAMVAMVNHTAIKELNELQHGSGPVTLFNGTKDAASAVETCSPPGGATNVTAKVEDGPFTWSEPLQGTLLSCYFWGYLVSQIPLAHVAENFSAKWVMLFSVAINVVCTLLTPVFTNLHYGGLILMRVLEGIGGGASFPAMHVMIASWAPPSERMVMSTIIYVGTSAGTALSILLAGMLSAQWGWKSVFYVMGLLSCIWMLLWTVLVQDNPNKQRFISAEERLMITSSLGTEQKVEHHPAVPWGKVFKSIPFWAILIAHTCNNFGWYMFLIEIPFYMKQVLKFNVASNAALSALPYFPMIIFSIVLGKLLDTLQSKGKISTTFARKTATSICTIVPGICLLILCYIGCLHYEAVTVMSVGIVAMGAMFSGFLSNHIDIAPNFAGTLVALTNTAATLPGIIVPLFVGFVTHGNQNISAWRIIFGVTIVLFALEFLVFVIFGSGSEQPWNKSGSPKDPEAKDEKTPLKDIPAKP